MWPTERESLAVWADELQARGEPLGQLIATSLRADELERRALLDPAERGRAEAVAAEAESLRLGLAERLLGPAVGELPRLRLRWHCGIVRSIHLDRVVGEPAPADRLVREVVTKLVQRPASRFLDQIHLDTIAGRDVSGDMLLREIYGSESCARPRLLALGSMPGHFRRLRAPELHAHQRPRTIPALPETGAGLGWLVLHGQVHSLPWATGDRPARERALERVVADWTPTSASAIARALWDGSFRVRRRVLELLPELPDAAAPALLPALAIEADGARSFGDVASRCVARIAAERPSWVAAVAEEFCFELPFVARWLSGANHGHARAAARRAIPRTAAMLERLERLPTSRGWRAHDLRRALAGFERDWPPTPAPARLEDETIAELIEKIGEHRA